MLHWVQGGLVENRELSVLTLKHAANGMQQRTILIENWQALAEVNFSVKVILSDLKLGNPLLLVEHRLFFQKVLLVL